jgi:hypothetical protein
MTIEIPAALEVPATSLMAVHAFICALPTRGGLCDCQPPQLTAEAATGRHEATAKSS